MTKSNILGSDLLVQTASKDDTLLQQAGKDVWGRDPFRKVDSCHTGGLILGLRSNLLESKICDGFLDLLRCSFVGREVIVDRPGENLLEGSIEGVNQLRGRRGKVGSFLGFIILHDCGKVSTCFLNANSRVNILGNQFFHEPK